MKTKGCQFPDLQTIAGGNAGGTRLALSKRIKLLIRRRLSPDAERALKKRTNSALVWFYSLTSPAKNPLATATPGPGVGLNGLKAGDLVRVRSKEEIKATLNHWRQLKGCTFMEEMWPYCGTTQRVFKLMRRFVDERDLRAKKCHGIVLLEGVMCQGTADFGRCDRSCLIFWREEWLEKINNEPSNEKLLNQTENNLRTTLLSPSPQPLPQNLGRGSD